MTSAACADAREIKAKLLREKCKKVNHDRKFSGWKVLVGSTDWADHASGVPGATRYRTQNLPESFSPGVYELGLVRASLADSRRKLRRGDVLVVYVGQAEDVRKRMQQYGKDGSHLGNAKSAGSPYKGGGGLSRRGIFEESFELGYAVAYRWSMTVSKEEALAAESLLLSSFDYLWNMKLNGPRRLDDIPLAPSNFTAMTKRVMSPFRCIVDPLTAAAELWTHGPAVASLQKPTHSVPKQENVLIVNEGSRSPLPAWLEATLGARKAPQAPASVQAHRQGEASPVFSERKASGAPFKKLEPDEVVQVCFPENVEAATQEEKQSKKAVVRCSVPLPGGGVCESVPLKGRRRCPEHKGIRVV